MGLLEAFKNFAERTKVDDVRSLVARMLQTDRFGTSFAQALRTFAEAMRTKRRQNAEERDAVPPTEIEVGRHGRHGRAPRPKVVQTPEPTEVETPEYLPPSLRGTVEEEEPQPQARARAIFHAAEEAKPFDPADLNFEFDESAETDQGAVPKDLQEPSPSQQLQAVRRGPFSSSQWAVLGGMLLVECCVIAGFVYLILSSAR